MPLVSLSASSPWLYHLTEAFLTLTDSCHAHTAVRRRRDSLWPVPLAISARAFPPDLGRGATPGWRGYLSRGRPVIQVHFEILSSEHDRSPLHPLPYGTDPLSLTPDNLPAQLITLYITCLHRSIQYTSTTPFLAYQRSGLA